MQISRQSLARWAAPAAFLLGVTVAVLLIRAGLGGGGSGATTAQRDVTRAATVRTAPAARTATTATPVTSTAAPTRTAARYYTVQRGDTFGSIAAREHTTVAAIEALNPGVSSNSLQIGQKIRVK